MADYISHLQSFNGIIEHFKVLWQESKLAINVWVSFSPLNDQDEKSQPSLCGFQFLGQLALKKEGKIRENSGGKKLLGDASLTLVLVSDIEVCEAEI